MKTLKRGLKLSFMAVIAGAALMTAGCASMNKEPAAMGLSGAQEVPPNMSAATGASTLMIAADKSVSGTVTVSGMIATAAHIHQAPAPGANGPVIVPLTKTSDTTFDAPASASLTDEQYAAYKAGNLYVNVHTAAYPGGEIRMPLTAK